jgi:O-antigen ligase
MIPNLVFNDSKASVRYCKIIYYSLLGYIVSLYIKNAPVVSNGLIIILLVLAFISVKPRNFFNLFASQKVNLGILLFFICEVISVIFSIDKTGGFNILSIRLPLFILPCAFCLINFDNNTWKKVLAFYVITTVVASMVGFFYGTYMVIHENNTAYFYNDNISELLLGKQAAYFGLYINIAILSCIYMLKDGEKNKKKGTTFLYLFITWLLFINYMLASKMSTISIAGIIICIAFVSIVRNKKILEGLILVFGLVIGIVVLNNFFPNTFARFKTINQTSFKFDNTNSENSLDTKFDSAKWSSGSTRMALWTCGREIFVKHPIFGTGLGDIRNSLKEKYAEKHFEYALNTNKNLHCQYFDIAVSMGTVGLLLFLFLFFVYPIKVFISNRQDFAVSVFICVGLCLLTENMFDRLQGEQIIAFILPLSVKIFDVKEEVPITDYQ